MKYRPNLSRVKAGTGNDPLQILDVLGHLANILLKSV